uniref:Uncharacterized protein n=1 Tax=Arundo donax TaxID=35708 RepID=A0A0A9FFZ6_ARUDO
MMCGGRRAGGDGGGQPPRRVRGGAAAVAGAGRGGGTRGEAHGVRVPDDGAARGRARGGWGERAKVEGDGGQEGGPPAAEPGARGIRLDARRALLRLARDPPPPLARHPYRPWNNFGFVAQFLCEMWHCYCGAVRACKRYTF